MTLSESQNHWHWCKNVQFCNVYHPPSLKEIAHKHPYTSESWILYTSKNHWNWVLYLEYYSREQNLTWAYTDQQGMAACQISYKSIEKFQRSWVQKFLLPHTTVTQNVCQDHSNWFFKYTDLSIITPSLEEISWLMLVNVRTQANIKTFLTKLLRMDSLLWTWIRQYKVGMRFIKPTGLNNMPYFIRIHWLLQEINGIKLSLSCMASMNKSGWKFYT